MDDKLTWREVLDPKFDSLLLSDIMALARQTGYKYFVCDGLVYSLVYSPMRYLGTVDEVIEPTFREMRQQA